MWVVCLSKRGSHRVSPGQQLLGKGAAKTISMFICDEEGHVRPSLADSFKSTLLDEAFGLNLMVTSGGNKLE